MHEAYVAHPASKLSVQIESIAAFDNHVILGTRNGQLLMYSIEIKGPDNKIELQLMKFNKNFSKKPITQIEVVPKSNLLFSLSDGLISVSDVTRQNFSLIHSAQNTKGASLFCLDVNESTTLTGETAVLIRMCVSIKRKLQFWYWKHNQLLPYKEAIDVNGLPKALAWTQDVICVGFKTEYVLYDISKDPKKEELFPTSSSRTIDPCICLINSDVFGVIKDELFIGVDITTIWKRQDEGVVDFKTGAVSNEVDMFDEKNNRKLLKPMSWSQPVNVLVWDDPYILGIVSTGMEVRSLGIVGNDKDTLIQSFPDLSKVRFLVKSARGSLFAASFSELWFIQAIDFPKQRQKLLIQKNFQLALQITNISDESETEKNEKIHQIQTLYAFELFKKKQFSEAMKVFAKLRTDPCDVIRLFPDLLPQDDQNNTVKKAIISSDFPVLEDKDLENGLLALIDYLTEVRFQVQSDMKNPTDSKTYSKSKPLLSIIDTTLLKCYLQTNDSLVAPLLRLNHCHLEESEKTLKKHSKLGELIILYQTKGQHKWALELLRSQACVPGSSLNGHERTIEYLQHLGVAQKQLIFEFSDWVLKQHPDDGLKIFIEDIQEVEQLPRAEVLDFLLKNHKPLVIPYLEHIINVWKEQKAMFHNILILQYKEKVQQLSAAVKDGSVSPQSTKSLEALQSKLLDLLRTSDKYVPETVLQDFPSDSLFEERAIILGKLQKHEKVLAIYIQILGDVKKATDYCETVYAKDPDIFAYLVITLLKPPSSPPYTGVQLHPNCLNVNMDNIFDILNKYANKINPAKILPVLPDNIALHRLRPFLEAALCNQLERTRQNQILKGLLYAEDLQIQEQRMHYEMKSIAITDFTVCPVCKKRFTNQSAFVRYPDGEIVHYSCQRKPVEVNN